MKQEEFEEIKNTYLNTQPPRRLNEGGWLELVGKLNKKSRRFNPLFFRLVLTCFVIVIFAGGSLVKASQVSVPGEVFYPVKRLAEDLVSEITGDEQKKVESKAREVLKVADENDEEKLQKATEEYKKTVEAAGDKVGDREKERLNDNLRNQGRKFEEVKRERPHLSKELDKAIDAARRGAGDVKGEKDRREGREGKEGENQKEEKDKEENKESDDSGTDDD